MSEVDGSEDVNDFLLRIRELGDQRDKEDEERTRKLEEEILQGRKERQARRAERARSLSPTKESTSNAGTPHSMRSTMDASMQDLSSSPANTRTSTPSNQQSASEDNMAEEIMSKPAPPAEINGRKGPEDRPRSQASKTPDILPSNAMPLSRSGTLSWQQRPSSRGTIAGRSRPLSMVASENRAARSPRASVEPTPVQEETTSRSEITQSLGAKDPAFFRQTQDRGLGSAAFRKNKTDSVTNMSAGNGAMRLPGQSRETSLEPEKTSESPPESARRSPPSKEDSLRAGRGPTHRLSASTSPGSMRSPLPTMSSQRFEPPTSDSSSSYGTESTSTSRTLAMSPSQGRVTGERIDRPASPTKGLGGFVQSAMLKRSDSVNKRWSAQVGPGLSRGNSIASNRSGYDGSRPTISAMGPPQDFRSAGISRESSPASSSRPGSGHGNFTPTRRPNSSGSPTPQVPRIKTDISAAPDEGFAKPAPILRKDTSSFSEVGGMADRGDAEKSVPSSPTKKWSPSKASWLENAINKPDSPKPKAAPPQQPSWMADLNKAKQQRGSVDLGRSGTFKEISTGGFMRSPPPGGFSKSTSLSGLPSGFSAGVAKKRKSETPPESVQVESFQDEAVTDKEPVSLPKSEASKEETLLPDKVVETPRDDLTAKSQPSFEKPSPSKTLTNDRDSPSTRPKPATPPKKDFTSTLKPHKVTVEKASKDEPEFKNVFGKLKKTQTQQYVAPDELKDNILRGKAGLAFTGGPKRAERKDEFKESILQKKEAMKGGLPSASTTIRNTSKAKDAPIPEALAKREGLARSRSNAEITESSEAKPQQPEPSHTPPSSRDDVTPPPPDKPTAELERPTSAAPVAGSSFNASLAGILSRGPPLAKPGSNPILTTLSTSRPEETSAITMAQGSSTAPQLSHMTKGRARGPKRRLPTAIDQTGSASAVPHPEPAAGILINPSPNQNVSNDKSRSPPPKEDDSRHLANITNNNRKVSQPTSPRKPSTSIVSLKDVKSHSPATKPSPKEPIAVAGRSSPGFKQKAIPMSAGETPRKSSSSVGPPLAIKSDKSPDPQKPAQTVEPPTAGRQLPSSGPTEEIMPPISVKGAAAVWQTSNPVQRNGARSPIKLPTRKDEEAAHEQAGLRNLSPPTFIGLGIETMSNKPQTPTPFARSLPTPPMLSPKSPKSPPLPGKKPPSIANRIPSNNLSPYVQLQKNGLPTSEAARTISDFFGESAKSTTKLSIDTQAVIASCSSHNGPEKIKTLRKQIFEVTGDGKLLPVPSHQEHILFEENLYICTHVFGGSSGTRTTEVYLWYGDCVPISAVEDSLLFARKVTKDNNGKLVVFKQGKETSNFFQALGGIVITRRGSSRPAGSPSSSSASYMLCARRHVGQIAFDEVEFSPATLCKGFPYIISTRFNKLYLWKGSGSGADELGCARLIGMDLGLTGEIEEVDEGQETSTFWQAFPPGRNDRPTNMASQYWHLKAGCEKYTTRMFTVDAEPPRPKSSSSYLSWGRRGSAPATEETATMNTAIKEIIPFAQGDMADDGIYVLDAFFEIFVIATAKSKCLLPSFRAALIFAQEYGILIASAEDRPFVPASKVVLGRDAPEGVKRAFRKWEEKRGPCIVVGLNEALQATRNE